MTSARKRAPIRKSSLAIKLGNCWPCPCWALMAMFSVCLVCSIASMAQAFRARIYAVLELWPRRFRWSWRSRITCTSLNSIVGAPMFWFELSSEIDGLLRLPDFAYKFVERAIELFGARAGALALFQDGRFQTAALHLVPPRLRGSSEYRGLAGASEDDSVENPALDDRARGDDQFLRQHLAQALTELAARRSDAITLRHSARSARYRLGCQSRLERLRGGAASRF